MARGPSILVGVLLGATFLAGCLDEGANSKSLLPEAPVSVEGRRANVGSSIEIFAQVKALLVGVPCEAPFDASKTTANLKLLANLTFREEERSYGSRELDVKGDLALTTLAGFGGIGILDLRDPLHPLQLSVIKAGGEADVKFSPDNLTALVGGSSGISLIDVRDPVNPIQVGRWNFTDAPQPPRGGVLQNAHMLYTAEIKGQQWAFVAPNSNTGVWILKLEGAPEARRLTYVTQTLPIEGGPLGPHDMVVQYDADLKMHVLYSADGYHGWAAFNVNDPEKPELIGGIVKPEPGYTHTIQAAKVGSRRLVATIQEVGVNVLEVYDATNLRAPVLLATWQVQAGSTFPQHNFNIVGGRLYLAHYANGLFVFDLNKLGSTPLVSELKPVAHYGGAATTPNPAGFSQFYDVVLKAGVVYGASYSAPTSGIHVIGDGCMVPGDEKLTSFG